MTDPTTTRRLALVLGLRLALREGRLHGISLTPWEVHAANEAIDRLDAELAVSELSAAA